MDSLTWAFGTLVAVCEYYSYFFFFKRSSALLSGREQADIATWIRCAFFGVSLLLAANPLDPNLELGVIPHCKLPYFQRETCCSFNQNRKFFLSPRNILSFLGSHSQLLSTQILSVICMCLVQFCTPSYCLAFAMHFSIPCYSHNGPTYTVQNGE